MERKGMGEDGNGEGLQLSRIAVGVVPFPQPLSLQPLTPLSPSLTSPGIRRPRSSLRALMGKVCFYLLNARQHY